MGKHLKLPMVGSLTAQSETVQGLH